LQKAWAHPAASMSRKLVKTADSPSLWNYSLSPGWTQETSEILRLAIIKFGCGNWKAIIESNCLPGKTRSQLNMQTQRMVGQQSIAQFKGIHLDTRAVWKDVQERHRNNPDSLIKNGLIINSGNNQTKEEKEIMRRSNMKKYTLPRKVIESVRLPVVSIDMVEGKGKKRRVKEKKALLPEDEKKLRGRLQVLRDRLAVLEKELKDRGVPIIDPRSRLGGVTTGDAVEDDDDDSDDFEGEGEGEATFEINEDYIEDDEEEGEELCGGEFYHKDQLEEEYEETEDIGQNVQEEDYHSIDNNGAQQNGFEYDMEADDDDDSDFEEPIRKKRKLVVRA